MTAAAYIYSYVAEDSKWLPSSSQLAYIGWKTTYTGDNVFGKQKFGGSHRHTAWSRNQDMISYQNTTPTKHLGAYKGKQKSICGVIVFADAHSIEKPVLQWRLRTTHEFACFMFKNFGWRASITHPVPPCCIDAERPQLFQDDKSPHCMRDYLSSHNGRLTRCHWCLGFKGSMQDESIMRNVFSLLC